jgi:hypothetical protein
LAAATKSGWSGRFENDDDLLSTAIIGGDVAVSEWSSSGIVEPLHFRSLRDGRPTKE